MKKYTEAQKQRAFKKLARAYGKWNEPDYTEADKKSRSKREWALWASAWQVIVKTGQLNDYYLAIGDGRAKRSK